MTEIGKLLNANGVGRAPWRCEAEVDVGGFLVPLVLAQEMGGSEKSRLVTTGGRSFIACDGRVHLAVSPQGVGGMPAGLRISRDRRNLFVLGQRLGEPSFGQQVIGVSLTPTSGSWLNLVEVFFSIITRQAIRRGSYTSVKDLIAAIRRFIDGWNDRCQPFVWTKTADDLLDHCRR